MITSQPESCHSCPLHGKSEGFCLKPEGNGTSGVMILGEALGREEMRDSLPFRPYAQAGSMLERLFRMSSATRSMFTVYNTVNCHPPNDWLLGAPWYPGAIESCRPNVLRVIDQAKPRVIVTLGNVPTAAMTGMSGPRRGVSYLRGYAIPTPSGLVVPSFHPSFLQRGAKEMMGVVSHDIRRAVELSQQIAHGRPFTTKPTRYITTPSLEDALAFERRCIDNPNLSICYDMETASSAFEDEDKRGAEDETETPEKAEEIKKPEEPSLSATEFVITQIQFSLEPYTGICFQWTEPFISIAKRILALPNHKFGHNIWNFDNPRLLANGCVINGTSTDTMWLWHHLQPDLPANLQFVASFHGMDFPWKHLAETDMMRYGCADVDAPHRFMRSAPDHLKQLGIERGYERHIIRLWPILKDSADRGVPVNKTKLDKLEEKIRAAQEVCLREHIVPAVEGLGLGKIEPKTGLKGDRAPQLKALRAKHSDAEVPTILFTEADDKGRISVYRYMQMEFSVTDPDTLVSTKVLRWCRKYDFNPRSAEQIKDYMRAKKHPIPLEFKTKRETTGRMELERLAKKVKDPFYNKILEYRSFDKLITTYCKGWQPKEDGCVHTTWTFRPATGQLSSTEPNVQNAIKHSGLGKEFRDCIEAPDGHILVEFDYSSFHVLTLGFEAGDPDYMRAARLDMHSLVSGHVLRTHKIDQLFGKPDDELREYLAWYKSDPDRKFHRDKKAKPCILGYGFGLGYRKLYNMNRESFSNEKEAKNMLDLLDGIFPVTAHFREEIKHKAARECRLVSRHGYHRRFYDVFEYWGEGRLNDAVQKGKRIPPRCKLCGARHDNGEDSEKAIAFLPANDAFGTIKDAMLSLEELGWMAKAKFINQIHDSLMFCMPKIVVDEALPIIHQEMTKPSTVLTCPKVAPGGLTCAVEVQAGPTWSTLKKVDMEKGIIV